MFANLISREKLRLYFLQSINLRFTNHLHWKNIKKIIKINEL